MKKLAIILFLILVPTISYSATVWIFNEVDGTYLRLIKNHAEESDYKGRTDVIINPDMSAIKGVPIRYWKKGVGDSVVEMTAIEKTQIDNAIRSVVDNQVKAQKKNELDNDLIVDAVLEFVITEINTLRTLNALPELTKQKIKSDLKSKIEIKDR